MGVDREQWAEKLNELPHWRCPTCNKGVLVPIKDKTAFQETGPSVAARDHEAWEPDWTFSRFSSFMQCSMAACGEVAVVSGEAPTDFVEYQDEYEHYAKLFNRFVVKSVSPSPMPIQLPNGVPEAIEATVRVAASLTWSSAEAAGNAIRQAVELSMDNFGVTATSPKGAPLTLHQRIVEFAKTDTENGEVLLAVKWLGNSGSHPGGLTRDDVLDAFDMIEYVFEARYGTTKKDLLAKVAAINAHKGPIKPTHP